MITTLLSIIFWIVAVIVAFMYNALIGVISMVILVIILALATLTNIFKD